MSRGVRLSRAHLYKSSFKYSRYPQSFKIKANFEIRAQNFTYDFSISSSDNNDQLKIRSERLFLCSKKLMGLHPKGARIYKKTHGAPNKIPVKELRSFWDSCSPWIDLDFRTKEEITGLGRFAIFSPQTAILRGTASPILSTKPLGLFGENLAKVLLNVIRLANTFDKKNAVKEIYSKIARLPFRAGWTDLFRVGPFDHEVISSQVITDKNMLYIRDKYLRKGREYLSPYDASEGSLYLAFIAALMGHPETPPIFALDNVDGTLNPGLVRKAVEVMAEVLDDPVAQEIEWLPKQIFLTSHNPTAIDALDLFNPEHRLFVVSRDEKGHTTFQRIQPPDGTTREAWILQNQGRRLSELWLDGRIPGALG